jgi:hypothetical protein
MGCRFYGKTIDYANLRLPNCERICDTEATWMSQNVMLGTRKQMDEIADAFEKVMENIDELKA